MRHETMNYFTVTGSNITFTIHNPSESERDDGELGCITVSGFVWQKSSFIPEETHYRTYNDLLEAYVRGGLRDLIDAWEAFEMADHRDIIDDIEDIDWDDVLGYNSWEYDPHGAR